MLIHGRVLLLTALLAFTAGFAALAEYEKKAPEPLWKACNRAVDWFHAAELPDPEAQLIGRVAKSRLDARSRERAQKSINQAPSLDEALAEAKRRQTLPLLVHPGCRGPERHPPAPGHRYVMTGPFSAPDVTARFSRRVACLTLPTGGALAQKYGLSAPRLVQPGFRILKPDGTVASRIDGFQCA